MIWELVASLRMMVATIAVCVVGYGALVLAGAAVISPAGRAGNLAVVDGNVVGSWRIAQGFTRDEYFWGRPSAVNYAADAAGGSNLSPTNPAIRERAQEILSRLGATPDHLAPADLVTASGSGLDPDITEQAAEFQVPRVARARGVSEDLVRGVIARVIRPADQDHAQRLVSVLRLNMELDRTARTGGVVSGTETGDND